MSRQINPEGELTDDEVAYLESRGLQSVLDQNALHLMGGGSSEDPYKGWLKDDWFGELEKRNASRDDDEKITAESDTKDGYKAAILADDANASE